MLEKLFKGRYIKNQQKNKSDLVSLMIKEEVGPVWIRLHVSELKQFPEAQNQDLFTNLTRPKVKKHVS